MLRNRSCIYGCSTEAIKSAFEHWRNAHTIIRSDGQSDGARFAAPMCVANVIARNVLYKIDQASTGMQK